MYISFHLGETTSHFPAEFVIGTAVLTAVVTVLTLLLLYLAKRKACKMHRKRMQVKVCGNSNIHGTSEESMTCIIQKWCVHGHNAFVAVLCVIFKISLCMFVFIFVFSAPC